MSPNNALIAGFNTGSGYQDHSYIFTPVTNRWYHFVSVLDTVAQRFYIYVDGQTIMFLLRNKENEEIITKFELPKEMFRLN